MEVTELGRYYDTNSAELYAQWEILDRWWISGGGNWLKPDYEDTNVSAIRRIRTINARR